MGMIMDIGAIHIFYLCIHEQLEYFNTSPLSANLDLWTTERRAGIYLLISGQDIDVKADHFIFYTL